LSRTELITGILALQDAKRELAKAALSGNAKNLTKLTLADIMGKSNDPALQCMLTISSFQVGQSRFGQRWSRQRRRQQLRSLVHGLFHDLRIYVGNQTMQWVPP
jgi:hypothetical protein